MLKQLTEVRKTYLDEFLNDKEVEYCYLTKKDKYLKSINPSVYVYNKNNAAVFNKYYAIGLAMASPELNLMPIDPKDREKVIRLQIRELKKQLTSK